MSEEGGALSGAVLEGACLTVEDLASAAAVSRDWLLTRIEEGLIAATGPSADKWRFSAMALHRVKRLQSIEHDFEAAPELAALVTDLLEELDMLRRRRETAGLL